MAEGVVAEPAVRGVGGWEVQSRTNTMVAASGIVARKPKEWACCVRREEICWQS